MDSSVEQRKGFLAALTHIPGHIEDVARKGIELARLQGKDFAVELHYGSTLLHIHGNESVDDVRRKFEIARGVICTIRVATA